MKDILHRKIIQLGYSFSVTISFSIFVFTNYLSFWVVSCKSELSLTSTMTTLILFLKYFPIFPSNFVDSLCNLHTSLIHHNPNTFVGLVGKVRKKTISGRRKEGRGEKKRVRSAPAGPGARTRDLPRARWGSPAARHGGCLDKQAFPCL